MLLQSQICNADETGLFWHSVPEDTQASMCEKLTRGRKISKDRISHKLTPVIVGKSSKPKVLKIYNESSAHFVLQL